MSNTDFVFELMDAAKNYFKSSKDDPEMYVTALNYLDAADLLANKDGAFDFAKISGLTPDDEYYKIMDATFKYCK